MEKNNVGKLTGGLIILYIGVVYLLYYLGYLGYHLNKLWPGILIIIGFGIMLKYFKK
ncbi:hypothetical protein KY328_04200 [Candidatus Woesearchaeota archaeon]|nr:hypothetical protein [Candidatus Woesearchaeota archaeon]MBW3022100.1 hypothetical protein [Candidatus Woesearchaeota archaeon]